MSTNIKKTAGIDAAPVPQPADYKTAEDEQAASWMTICDVLSDVSPGWASKPGTGEQCAVQAIRTLAASASQLAVLQSILQHDSDCSLHNMPAYPAAPCDCSASDVAQPAAHGEAALREAMDKINAIRNSMIGLQSLNWSEHVYPLVAALDAAGYEGMGYPAARKYFGSLLDRAVQAEDKLAALATTPVPAPPAGQSEALRPTAVGAGDLGEPNMLWDAEDSENCYGDGPEDFANNYASNCMVGGDECEVDVLCAYRGHKRTMRITLEKNDYDEELANPVLWSWADAPLAAQGAENNNEGVK